MYPTGLKGTEFNVPDGVTEIGGSYIFAGSALKKITLSKSVYIIDDTAFCGALKLENITVKNGNTAFVVRDGVLFNTSGDLLVCYPAAKLGESYNVPENVQLIGVGAFYGNRSLMRISFPSSVREIRDEAFGGSVALELAEYAGTRTEWDRIVIGNGNSALRDAKIGFGK